MEDRQLLGEYAQHGSESAFRTLVERHLGMVHACALRQVNDPHLAEEVAQAVFILLARKAGSLPHGVMLPGWLFRTTRFVAAHARRGEQRRRKREQEAFEMQTNAASPDTWKRIAPILDEGLEQLGERDRNAVLLRFVEGRNHREVGAVLGLTEEAARKRVDRSIEKLRGFFTGRGFTLSATVLGAALAANAATAAPAALASNISSTAVASAAATASTLPAIVNQTLEAWCRAKIKLGAVLAASGAAVAVVVLTASSPHSPPSVVIQTNGGNAAAALVQAPVTAASAQNRPAPAPTGPAIRFHVVAKDNGEPVGKATLLVSTITPLGLQSQVELATDSTGTANVPVPPGPARMDISAVASGWGARFVSWITEKDGDFPGEYTLRVERVVDSVGGWLRDEIGNPVSGAEVWIQFGGTSGYAGVETPRERPGVFDGALVAVSDRQGHWSCSVIPAEYRSFQLRAERSDLAMTNIETTWSDGVARDPGRESLKQLWAGTLVTVMNPGFSLYGRVADPAGQPVSGARLTYRPSPQNAPALTTDMEGRFAFHGLRRGLLAFTLTGEGFAPEYQTLQVQETNQLLEIKMKPGALLRIKVVDSAGAAVPGTKVALTGLAGLTYATYGFELKWDAVTGDDGRVEWRSAPVDKKLAFAASKDNVQFIRGKEFKADGQEHVIVLPR